MQIKVGNTMVVRSTIVKTLSDKPNFAEEGVHSLY